jgi:hypothetical protein
MAIIHCYSNPGDLRLYERLSAEAEREAMEAAKRPYRAGRKPSKHNAQSFTPALAIITGGGDTSLRMGYSINEAPDAIGIAAKRPVA